MITRLRPYQVRDNEYPFPLFMTHFPGCYTPMRLQVEALCGSLACCQPHYVRCIKPNSTKAPLEMDDTMIMHPVSYTHLTLPTKA